MRDFLYTYWAHLQVEVKQLFSLHRRTGLIILFIPVVYTLLFGGLFYENAVTAVPVAVYNLDRGASGRQLVQDLASSPDLRLYEMYGTRCEADDDGKGAHGCRYDSARFFTAYCIGTADDY